MTAWRDWIESARAADIKVVADDLGCDLKKAAANEWVGPCPIDGGHDRFSVNTRKRVFNCRGSDGGGDVIALVEHCTGCSFLEAVERITGEARPDRSRDETMEERAARMRRNQDRMKAARTREAEDRKRDEIRAKKDEEAVADVLDRSVDVIGTYGWRYITETRGLRPNKRFLGDIKFVAGLDYWGSPDNGTGEIRLLATLPAIVAIIRDYAGAVIGISQTYLDPVQPRKWEPPGPRNSAKKIRGQKKGGMIRLGRMTENLALAEGWENALAWAQMGGADGLADLCLCAAVDIGNLAGGYTGYGQHPVEKADDGAARRIPNGTPNIDEPGAIVPDGVHSVIIICDANSEVCRTAAHYTVAAKRFLHHGMSVQMAWPELGYDWNDMLIREAEDEKAGREAQEIPLRRAAAQRSRPQGRQDAQGYESRPSA